MKSIEHRLRVEIVELEEIIREAEKRLVNAPQGYLRIQKKKDKVEYYYKNALQGSASGNGKYMKKSEHHLAKQIVQRDYDTIIIKRAKERVGVIENFLEKYRKISIGNACEKLGLLRRELLDSVIMSDEKFIKQWSCKSYKRKTFIDEEKVLLTERGEYVRSKSEKIIADKLYLLGIPYRYECPIVLQGNITIYPDFTILKMPERKEVYLEHFGMMDDMEYVNKVLYKLNTYEKNGIYLGVNLFLTYETGKNPLNIQSLDEMLRVLFCEENNSGN